MRPNWISAYAELCEKYAVWLKRSFTSHSKLKSETHHDMAEWLMYDDDEYPAGNFMDMGPNMCQQGVRDGIPCPPCSGPRAILHGLGVADLYWTM